MFKIGKESELYMSLKLGLEPNFVYIKMLLDRGE